MSEPTRASGSGVFIPWNSAPGKGTALVCIPWAGAGAIPFRAWGPVFHHVATLYGVRLAGRESRHVEPMPASLDQVAAELVSELHALDARRVALFGHCSGALLAFETAKALRGSNAGPALVHLLVASQLPPFAIPNARHDDERDLMQYVPMHLRDEPELVELLLPVLAADSALVSDYTYTPDVPLDVPLTVLYGTRDERLDRADVDGWRRETTSTTTFYEIAGADHLFSGDTWLALALAVRAALS